MQINTKKIEAHRIVLNESPRIFANRIGVSHAWYYNLINESLKNNSRLETINKIADALGIPAKDLIK